MSELHPWARRAAIALGLVIAGGLIGWIGHSVLMRPDDVLTVRLYQNWRLACAPLKEKKGGCELTETVYDDKSQSQIAALSLGRDEKDDSTVLAVTVPFNVLLPAGLGLAVDSGQAKVYQYKTCTARGCVALIPVDDKLAAALAQAHDAKVVVAGLDGKSAALPVSMDGYAAAHHALETNDALRKSWWRRLWS